jgi:quercetin dioxygenase-like cupin family protein
MSKERRSTREVLDADSLKAISEAIKPRTLDKDRKAALRGRILDRIRQSAPAPEGTLTIRADEREWHAIAPLVEIKVLYRDEAQNVQTTLWRVRPGARVEAHSHTLVEECLVLEGEIKVGDHYVRQGDMHIALPGHIHPPIESPTGALLLLRSEIRELPRPDF